MALIRAASNKVMRRKALVNRASLADGLGPDREGSKRAKNNLSAVYSTQRGLGRE
jgi:hypothetical protein